MDEEKITKAAAEKATEARPSRPHTKKRAEKGAEPDKPAAPRQNASHTAGRKSSTPKPKTQQTEKKTGQETAKTKQPTGQAKRSRRRPKKAAPAQQPKPQEPQTAPAQPEQPETPEAPNTAELAAVAQPAEPAALPEAAEPTEPKKENGKPQPPEQTKQPEKQSSPEPEKTEEAAEPKTAEKAPAKPAEPKQNTPEKESAAPEPEQQNPDAVPAEQEPDEPELSPEERAAAERRRMEITRTVQVSIEQSEAAADDDETEDEEDAPETVGSRAGRAVKLLAGWLLLVILVSGMIAVGGVYWLYKKATPDMIPAITVTAAGQQLEPMTYHWQVPVAGNYLKRTYSETLSTEPSTLETAVNGGNISLRVTPADCTTEVTVKDEEKQEVFKGSAQEFSTYRFTDPGSYTVKLVVSDGEGYQSEPAVSGHQTYEFAFDVVIKATVRLNLQSTVPGNVVSVRVSSQQTDQKPELTTTLPSTGFRASASGDGWVAYLPVPLDTEPGTYDIKVMVDGEVQELSLNITQNTASFRDYTSRSRLVKPYVGADDTPQEVLDLLNTAEDTIYWASTGFASPFSDSVEITLPYGMTEYVNRTATERKNNTGTGRTSINTVLSGRCDLVAPAGGKVLLAQKLSGVGNTLVIEHGAGVKTIYYGLRKLTVEEGTVVQQGDALGTTDTATVVEVRVGEVPVEPLRILRGQCDAFRTY